MRETDCANVEGLFRIIQSVPSPKAVPIKQWLAKVGYERIQDMNAPVRSLDRARLELEQKTGRKVVTGENFLPPSKSAKQIGGHNA